MSRLSMTPYLGSFVSVTFAVCPNDFHVWHWNCKRRLSITPYETRLRSRSIYMIITGPRYSHLYTQYTAVICGLLACLLAAPALAERTIRLATTTSTENTGLLKELLPHFERDSALPVPTEMTCTL
jgi:hypothetical protein